MHFKNIKIIVFLCSLQLIISMYRSSLGISILSKVVFIKNVIFEIHFFPHCKYVKFMLQRYIYFAEVECWMVRLVLVCLVLGLVGARDDDYPDEKVVERIPVFTTPSLRRLVNEGDRIRYRVSY